MKRFLKYVLLLLTLVGFLTSSLELDTKECKRNYNNENHTFITSQPGTYQASHVEVTAALPACFFSWWFAEPVSQQAITYYSAGNPDPPERLYLLYSVFLI